MSLIYHEHDDIYLEEIFSYCIADDFESNNFYHAIYRQSHLEYWIINPNGTFSINQPYLLKHDLDLKRIIMKPYKNSCENTTAKYN